MSLKYYKSITLNDNIIMSCDMLRLSFSLSIDKINNFNKFIMLYDLRHTNIDINCYRSNTLFNFTNLYQIKNISDKTSFALGLGFNSAKSKEKTTCFIEFNPNKTLTNNLVTPFLEYIKDKCNFIDVVRYDIAFDIPLNRELFNLVKDRRKYKKIYSLELNNKDLSDFTEYLGQRQNNGYVKLYNKQIESDLNSPLTRLEITLDKLEYENLQKEMPQLNIFKYKHLSTDILTDTEKVLLSLLLQNDNCTQYLYALGRKTKEKLLPYIADSYPIQITESDFYHFILLINKIIN